MITTGRTLTLRQAIVLVVVFGLLLPVLLVSGYSWFKRYHDDIRSQTEDLLQQNADVLSSGMQEALWNGSRESGNALLEAMMARNEDIVRIEVRDNAQSIFVYGEFPERRIGYTAVAEKPVVYRGRTIGSVTIEAGSTRLRKIMRKGMLESMIAVAAQAVLSIALILALLERRLVGPLQRLGLEAERLANRELDMPFTGQGRDEIGMLSRRLEDTRLSLRRLFEELDRKNRELEQDKEARILSEAKFAGAFRCNPDAVFIIRLGDGMVLDVNQAAEDITGYPRREAIGRSTRHLWVEPGERDAVYRKILDEGAVRNFAWSMRTRGGDVRLCLANGTTFSVSDERYLLTVVRDVTDQRRLEEQKAEADRALLRLAQGTQDIAGESFFELLVADLASALRTDHACIGLRADGASKRIRTIAAHDKGHNAPNYEYASRNTPIESVMDGHICVFSYGARESFPEDRMLAGHGWDSYAGAPLRDRAGNIVGVLAVMHGQPLGNPDLVRSLLQVFSERASAELERKRAEEELRASEQRFSTIFQSSPVAMFVTQVRGNHVIKDVNGAFERLFLRRREAVIGKNTIELALYCDLADRAAMIEELKMTGRADADREVWMYRRDGSRVLIQFSGHTFTLAGESFGILACADVTDKRRIENEIRELNATLEQRVIDRTEELQQANRELASTLQTLNIAQEELVRSEKLAALGSLVAGVAHELNTPIGNGLMVASALADQTRALMRDYAADSGLKRSALESYLRDAGTAGDILQRNLQRAADLVNSFKQVAVDQTSSQRRRFSLSEVVSEIMLTLWPTLKKTSYSVSQNIPDDLIMDSYPGPLGQVVTNLVNNALLHGFDGRKTGTVTITAKAGPERWIEMTVEDDGVGIPQANLGRIFDPFFTTRLGAGGSGLGLNITHNIVSGVLGGRIRVQSQLGHGTVFVLSLPAIAPHRQNEEEPPERLTSA